MGIKFISTGRYLPPKVLTNFDLEKMVDTSDEWIRTRTGIRERRILDKDLATSDMVYFATKEALKKANLIPKDIDCIIVATVTPDTMYPATACWVQKKFNIKGFPAFDIEAACSGFIYSVLIAQGLLKTGACKRAVVAGAETMSRAVNWDDRNTCVLFGDGAGVVIMEYDENSESDILAWDWGADGTIGNLLMQPAGGSRLPASH